ncbi:MAG: hypothetical protein HY978_02575 [Candidatus Liptonbacteria bacterium]|nr:hypothetical protein [Candidatus Liptonbacteria bacterium]
MEKAETLLRLVAVREIESVVLSVLESGQAPPTRRQQLLRTAAELVGAAIRAARDAGASLAEVTATIEK